MNWSFNEGKLMVAGKEIPLTSFRALTELRSVLKDKNATGPDPAYWVFRDIHDPDGPTGNRSDITVLAPGKIGEEYVKTHGHYHLGEGVEQYRLLAGQGLLLLQKPSFNFTSVEAARLIHLPLGQLVSIPEGWGHTLINIGNSQLVTENYEPPTIEQLYSAYEKNHGAAFYVLEHDGKEKIEPNPHYPNEPKLQNF